MEKMIKVNCYCFNQHCIQSIFFKDTCQVFTLLLNDVLTHPFYCTACNKELVSKPLLDFKRQLHNLIPIGVSTLAA